MRSFGKKQIFLDFFFKSYLIYDVTVMAKLTNSTWEHKSMLLYTDIKLITYTYSTVPS